MKRNLNSILLPFLATTGLFAGSAVAQSQINVGVVDMQECLNQYYKTALEVEKINSIAKEKQVALDARKADYENLTKRAEELDNKYKDTSLGNEPRQQAAKELQQIMQERLAKGREIAQAEQKARQEILEARQAMETALVAELREVVDAEAKKASLDLILDKSFLPKANKVIITVSDKVPDITEAIVAILNANAPPGTPKPAAPATGESPDAPAAPSPNP